MTKAEKYAIKNWLPQIATKDNIPDFTDTSHAGSVFVSGDQEGYTMNKFTITSENIEKAVETVSTFLQKYKIAQKDILRLTLALEDTLLNYLEAFGEDTVCSIKCIRHFGRLRVELAVNGDRCDVLASNDEDDFSRKLMSGIGMAPGWQYRNGQNIITFTPNKKKTSQMVYIVASILLALVGGSLSRLLPQTTQLFISEQLLTPIFDAFLGLLNGVSGIMIFLSVAWGICSIGDMSTLTTIGKKMVSRMLLMMTLISTVFALLILPLFHFTKGTGTGTVNLSGLFDMILGMIPANMLTPFTEGSLLQIIFIAVMVGVALLILGEKTSLVSSFVDQANTVVQHTMEVICSFVSIIIFISLYNMVLSGDFSVLLEAYKAPILILLGFLFAMCIYLFLICVTLKVKPTVFLRKMMPSFLIALTTASSSAALPTIMDTCKKQYGVDKKIINFGVPLGRIILGIGLVMEFIVISFCMSEIYAVSVTPLWIIMTIFTSVILKIATPPIPGGAVALYTILFNQLGIPLEGLAVTVAIDVIADFFATATDMFCLQSELVILSGKLHMLNTDKLRHNSSDTAI